MLFDFALQGFLLAVGNDHGTDFAAAVHDAHNRNLVLGSASGNAALPLRDMHVPGLTADEGFVNLDRTLHLGNASLLERVPDTVKHEPSGSLRHSNIAAKLVTTDSV